MSSLLSPFVTLGYISTATCQWRPMCHWPCPVVLQLCVTYAASVAPSANLFFCPSSPRWFCRDSTTTAPHSTASQGVWWIVCSPCSMRQRDWCTTVVSRIGSRRSCATCTDCAFLNASSSVWLFLCSAAVTRPQHLNTSRETCSGLMTTSLADDYDRRQLTSWLCVAHDSEQSVTVRSVIIIVIIDKQN